MARPEKIAEVEHLNRVFKDSLSIVLSDFSGLDVEKLTALRAKCRANGVSFRVVKNTLAIRSIQGTPIEELQPYFKGPTALAVSTESENLPAKVLAEFAKEHERPVFKAAVVEGDILDAADVAVLATLPSKKVLLSQLLAGIKGPGNGLVGVLQGTLRNLMNVLEEIRKKQESGSGEKPQQVD
jgi:large subunit ribosomal protein L10